MFTLQTLITERHLFINVCGYNFGEIASSCHGICRFDIEFIQHIPYVTTVFCLLYVICKHFLCTNKAFPRHIPTV